MENENQTPETGTFGEYSPESKHPVLLTLQTKIADLEAQVERTNALVAEKDTRILSLRDKYRTAEYSLEAKLKELLDDEEISVEVAQAIAEIFDGITLTKQVEIAYTISATVTVEVPYGADADEVANSTFVERVEFYTDFDGADVLEVDHDVDDWNVR